jgi:hypothetical protein
LVALIPNFHSLLGVSHLAEALNPRYLGGNTFGGLLVFVLPKGFTKLRSSGAATGLVACCGAIAAVAVMNNSESLIAVPFLGFIGLGIVFVLDDQKKRDGVR